MVLYVAEKAGRFLPSDAAGRARVHEWLFHVATDVSPTSSSIYYLSNQLPERPTAAIRLFEDRLARFLRNIDHRLGQVEFLAGALSVADLTFFPNYLTRRSMVEADPSDMRWLGLREAAVWRPCTAPRMCTHPLCWAAPRLHTKLRVDCAFPYPNTGRDRPALLAVQRTQKK